MCDGNIVYQGPPHKVATHFDGMFSFPRYANPADIAMKILSINYPKQPADDLHVSSLVERYRKENMDEDAAIAKEF